MSVITGVPYSVVLLPHEKIAVGARLVLEGIRETPASFDPAVLAHDAEALGSAMDQLLRLRGGA